MSCKSLFYSTMAAQPFNLKRNTVSRQIIGRVPTRTDSQEALPPVKIIILLFLLNKTY